MKLPITTHNTHAQNCVLIVCVFFFLFSFVLLPMALRSSVAYIHSYIYIYVNMSTILPSNFQNNNTNIMGVVGVCAVHCADKAWRDKYLSYSRTIFFNMKQLVSYAVVIHRDSLEMQAERENSVRVI